jgi:hypothetical protein
VKIILGCLVVIQTLTVLFLANLYRPPDRINPLLAQSESEKLFYEKYQKPATLDTVVTEIQRASFCQNFVIPTVDLWKENKDKKNASLKEKLGPELWKRCSDYVWSPVLIQDKKK